MWLMIRKKEWDEYAHHVAVLNDETGQLQKKVACMSTEIEKHSEAIKDLNVEVSKVLTGNNYIQKIMWAIFSVTVLALLAAIVSSAIELMA